MNHVCVKAFSVDAGHRVFGHESKCANMHGHTYRIEVHAQAKAPGSHDLDSLGRVIDFSVLKEKIGGWLDANWDHGFLYYVGDDDVRSALLQVGTKAFALRNNPTAENLAGYLLDVVCPSVLQGTPVQVVKVVVHETPTCYAEATL